MKRRDTGFMNETRATAPGKGRSNHADRRAIRERRGETAGRNPHIEIQVQFYAFPGCDKIVLGVQATNA
ncbi:MAG: hypothetical protein L6Q97_21065 [Thermoanaerobaculia bacterium]|nr:hypothetical protein [Thermoanaerobaculia bacterium]